MLYDNALDDSPILLDHPLCLTIVIDSWNDKNHKIVICEDTLIHKSPILFFNAFNHTIEDKYTYFKKY
jgi:hypothetical protein